MQNQNRWNSASDSRESIASPVHLPSGLCECKALAMRCRKPGMLNLFIEVTEK